MARRTLLVVDDDEDLREIFRTALVLAGYEVKEAADGLEALRSIDADPPDAVVLDLKMPHVSGYDVLYDLSVQAHTRKIPVVVVTGCADNLDHVDAACVLRKPVLPEELIRAVERCLLAPPRSRGT